MTPPTVIQISELQFNGFKYHLCLFIGPVYRANEHMIDGINPSFLL